MSQQELLAYIKPNLEKGFKAELLKSELLKAGWEEAAVNEAFASLEKSDIKLPDQTAEPQKKEVDIEPNFSTNSNANLELGSVQALNMVEKKEEKEVAKDQESETKTPEKDLQKKEGKKKMSFNLNPKLKLALIIILSLIILGALAFFAYARFQDSPMKVLQKSLLVMEEVSSFDYNLEIKGEYQWKDGNFSDIMADPFALLGAQEDGSQASALSPSKHQASLSLNGYSSTQTSNLDSRLDISFSSDEMRDGEKIEIETRFIQDQAYLRLSLPSVEMIDLSVLQNKWLKVPLEQEGANIFSDFSPSDGMDSETVMTEDSSSKNNNLTEDLWEKGNKLKEAVAKYEPFKVVDTFSGSLASGQKTYHYILEFDKKALENIFLELEAEDGQDQEEAAQEIREDMENIEIISGELVVGRDDFFMHNFSLKLTMKEGAYSDDMLQILSLNFDLSLQSFNQPINVLVPENSVALEEVMGELFETFLADSFGPELDWDDYEDVFQEDDWVQCIGESGAIFYGAFWCDHCRDQRDALDSAFQYINYVECSTDDGTGQLPVCQQAGIEGYPTWVFADGSREHGNLPLEVLAEKTGCNLPQEDDFIDMEADYDGDGLTDYEEIYIYKTNPFNSDTDGDDLTDFEEIMIFGTDPLNPDTDGDGYSDGEEVLNGYNPLGEGLLTDENQLVYVRDIKRISDIRQIMTALAIYYHIENTYPESLDQLTTKEPALLRLVPSAPVPPDGDCGSNNTYAYVFQPKPIGGDSSSYTLSYCLGAHAFGAEVGVNIATPAGLY